MGNDFKKEMQHFHFDNDNSLNNRLYADYLFLTCELSYKLSSRTEFNCKSSENYGIFIPSIINNIAKDSVPHF